MYVCHKCMSVNILTLLIYDSVCIPENEYKYNLITGTPKIFLICLIIGSMFTGIYLIKSFVTVGCLSGIFLYFFSFEERLKGPFCAGHLNFLDILTVFPDNNMVGEYRGITVAKYQYLKNSDIFRSMTILAFHIFDNKKLTFFVKFKMKFRWFFSFKRQNNIINAPLRNCLFIRLCFLQKQYSYRVGSLFRTYNSSNDHQIVVTKYCS